MSETNSSSKVVVLGVGTGGCRIAAELASSSSASRLQIHLIDTDEKALECYPEFNTLVIGSDWTDRQGCGGDMNRGEKAAGASDSELTKILKGAEMLILVSPLGGGTGSGAVAIISSLARRLKILSLCFVTRPFSFEGNLRFKNSEKAMRNLLKTADAVICIENDVLFKNLSGNFNSDFQSADRTLAECVAGISEMIFSDGLIKIDFVHVKQLLKQKDSDCHIGIGQAYGDDRITAAINELVESPTLGGSENISSSDAAIVTLMSGPDLSMAEINDCISKIKELFSENAELNIGVSTSGSRQNFLQLTALTIRNRTRIVTDEELNDTDTFMPTRKRSRKKEVETVYNIQGELPLQELTSGVFENLSPTLYHGQNLDIPTYLRQGLAVDSGDK
ncbi:MAG: cell division FtsZ family protein [Lentisphaeraceae bacterium]|nr:cell division FtsZ family protein [Lentisphaeraceae bacterium]